MFFRSIRLVRVGLIFYFAQIAITGCNLRMEVSSQFFRFMEFRYIRFFLTSVDCHFTEVSTHIFYTKLCHPLLY